MVALLEIINSDRYDKLIDVVITFADADGFVIAEDIAPRQIAKG